MVCYKVTDRMETIHKVNRLHELRNILNEVRYIEEYLLPPIVKETQKGIDHINNNDGSSEWYQFCFPDGHYMNEKITKLEDSIKYIKHMLKSDY